MSTYGTGNYGDGTYGDFTTAPSGGAVAGRLTIPFTVGTGQIVGQGLLPELWALYTTEDASEATPNWLDATSLVRSFAIDRGSENEFSDVDASQANLELDNRQRTFDPISNSLIGPLNRWWLRSQFAGETQDLFFGYAESYVQTWPGGGWSDAVAALRCSDEFKVLALTRLPVLDPPVGDYPDIVKFDEPAGYWRLDQISPPWPSETGGNNGDLRLVGGSRAAGSVGAIVGQDDPPVGSYRSFAPGSSSYVANDIALPGDPGDAAGLSAFAIEAWVDFNERPPGSEWLILGPNTGGAGQWALEYLGATDVIQWRTNVGGVTRTLQIARPYGGGTPGLFFNGAPQFDFHHVVGTVDNGLMKFYMDGVLVGSTAASGVPGGADPNQTSIKIGNGGNPSVYHWYDEVAFYRHELSAARILAHYQAGAQRGFLRQDLPGVRLNKVLDAASSHAPRRIRAGTRQMVGSRQLGQSALEEAKRSTAAESIDAVLYVARDGAIVFLDGGHRSASRWSTIQVTLDDDGTDLPYGGDPTFDLSDDFVANTWRGSRPNGTIQTASDAASIRRYFERTKDVPEMPVLLDSDVAAVVAAMLAKYKTPLLRGDPFAVNMADATSALAALRLDIGDRVEILRTPPGGGSRIDQQLFIRKVSISGANDRRPWNVVWQLIP